MRRRLRVGLAIGASFALASGSARADEEPITVTVSGSAAGGFATKTDEAARPRDVPDSAGLFEGVPGVRVRRLTGASSFATLSIRGAASHQVAVSLAGVPLTGAADPSLDFATLPLWPGASARVHRTFAPAALGGGYLGGLVEIQPVGGGGGARTEAYEAIGSFGGLRMRIADARPVGDGWHVATGLSASRSDGDFTYFDPNRQLDVVRKNADSRQVAALAQARRDIGAWVILITALASARRDGVAGPFDRPTLGTRLDRDRQLAALELRERDDSGRFLARFWVRREGRSFDDPLAEQGPIPGTSSDRVLSAGATLGRSVQFEKLILDGRLEESAESSSGVRLGFPAPRRDRFHLAAALDATYRANDVFTFVGAARGDLIRDRGDEDSARDVLPAAHLGVVAAVTPFLALAGHAGILSRAPSFLELLGDGGAYTPSPGLKSERALAADFGLRAVHGKSPRVELELVGFASSIRDLIVVVPVGLTSLRAQNVGDARILGAEASLAVAEGPVRALASYTRLLTEDRTDDASSRGAPLPGRPGHDLTFDLSVAIGPAVLRYGFDLVSGTTLDRAGTRELPTRIFHGVGAKIAIGKVQVIGQIDDLFDRRTVEVVSEGPRTMRYPTSDFLGYPLPGRRFTLALRWQL
ncbi:MAG: TonB-dependent receptor domain-containing protein [Polyangiales bacterium]